ncbi:hypothetical protein T484DRAFT_1742152 [Baffinella frigidus]|nr:hypothetical protein T484DRAFT_1742152 [Cryptophyta sp. CCMP2293]
MARTIVACVAVLLAAHCGSGSVPALGPHSVPTLATQTHVGQRMVLYLRGGLVEHELEDADEEEEAAAAEPEMFSRGLGEHVPTQNAAKPEFMGAPASYAQHAEQQQQRQQQEE